ncbi:hypothetical protein GF325_14970 [Candidatus Bathyarchaeota archaeon]|nr:hypothetical protein [Candidatus Bathyarchaeota archaeon]
MPRIILNRELEITFTSTKVAGFLPLLRIDGRLGIRINLENPIPSHFIINELAKPSMKKRE